MLVISASNLTVANSGLMVTFDTKEIVRIGEIRG